MDQENDSIGNYIDTVIGMSGMAGNRTGASHSQIQPNQPQAPKGYDDTEYPNEGTAVDGEEIPSEVRKQIEQVESEGTEAGLSAGKVAGGILGTVGLVYATKYLLSKYGAKGQALVEEAKVVMDDLNTETQQVLGADEAPKQITDQSNSPDITQEVMNDMEAADSVEGRSDPVRVDESRFGGDDQPVISEVEAEVDKQTTSLNNNDTAEMLLERIKTDTAFDPREAIKQAKEADIDLIQHPELMRAIADRFNSSNAIKKAASKAVRP